MAKKILLVDDSEAERASVALFLRREGFETIEAGDGAEGLEKAKNETFDLVIADMSLPLMNGLELIRELRQLPEYESTPTLLQASESELRELGRVDNSGVSGGLLKPFDGPKALTAISRLLK
ncbi:response regulator [Streptomyces sp. NPDC054904]